MQKQIEPFEVRSWCFHSKGCYAKVPVNCKTYCTGAECRNQGKSVLGDMPPRYTVNIKPRNGVFIPRTWEEALANA